MSFSALNLRLRKAAQAVDTAQICALQTPSKSKLVKQESDEANAFAATAVRKCVLPKRSGEDPDEYR